ncbi:protein lin-9 homolog [Lingula anatina]|uniref:Protein lin-9 homolog n=1 Tax=Lingula anatina TaxID=7574 RepID=A0A1S3K263_LINAN|nr:protein lin-9 homolog [Lingula anatina]|eukprot:XP_013416607.1 protein lin-9 homolog [Lingula anatina]
MAKPSIDAHYHSDSPPLPLKSWPHEIHFEITQSSSLKRGASNMAEVDDSGESNSRTPPARRGNPPRVRKKNRLIFNEDEETCVSAMRMPPKKTKYSSPARSILTTPDKRAAHTIGVRLRNLLKLPKAHKWVCYEWFYSNIDQVLFGGENDFCICLRETFPQLKLRKMSRVEWCKIRRLMGKPRRCSSAFFAEERAALEARRAKIRLLQQRKLNELLSFKDMPDEIPMPLVIGTKVTARLRCPQDGLFTGSVEALDTVSNTYRITFDRQGLGTHSIPDFEVLSNDPQETIPLSAFQQKHRPRQQNLFSPPRFLPGSPTLDNDPLLGSSPLKGRVMPLDSGTYGGFPIKFLVLVTRLSKILMVKKECLKQLKDMNTQAEKLKSYQEPLTMEFQKKYAGLILELDKLNKDLNDYLVGVQQFCQQLAPDQGLPALDQPSEIKRRTEEEAEDLVRTINLSQVARRQVRSEKMLDLVTKLTSMMMQIKTFAESDMNSFEFRSLQDSLAEVKETINPANSLCFQNSVEIHINHIQSGLSQMGNLHAFAASGMQF